MIPKKHLLIGIVGFISFMLFACTIFIGGPEYPPRTIPVSSEAVSQLQATIEQAFSYGATSGEITFTITEAQLTSFLHYKLQAQTDPFLREPQVFLQNGQVQVFGTARQGYIEATAAIILEAAADENGDLRIEIASADFGPLPAPEGLLEAITAMVEEAFTGALGPVATGIRLTDIAITDGLMTVSGQIR